MSASPDKNTAVAVGEFIVDEMITNSQSSVAESMKNNFTAFKTELDNALPDSPGAAAWELGKAMLKPSLSLPLDPVSKVVRGKAVSLSVGAMGAMHGLFQFKEKVNYRGDWDHKGVIKEKFGDAEKGSVVKRSDGGGLEPGMLFHRYGDYAYYFDIWSNIHYGYIGCFVGIDQWMLRDAAGLVQPGEDRRVARGFKHALGIKKMHEYDDPMDQVSIEIGIRLYKKFAHPTEGLKKDMVRALMREIAAAPYEYYHKVEWSRLEPCLKELKRSKPDPIRPAKSFEPLYKIPSYLNRTQ